MTCARCGTVFCVDAMEDSFYLSPHRVRYCSKVCNRKGRPSFRPEKRALRVRPGAMRRQVRRLRERDGDGCYLCGLLIDFTITDVNDPMHYSRDHVVPRALGGGPTLANVRLAHRRCNTEKGRELPAAAVAP